MKDARPGEQLWLEWGDDFSSSLTYYTVDHVSLDEDVVRRALASTLQRDGLADSLSDGFKLLESADVSFGYAGCLEDDVELLLCDEFGETKHGDLTDNYFPATFVEVLI